MILVLEFLVWSFFLCNNVKFNLCMIKSVYCGILYVVNKNKIMMIFIFLYFF